MLTKSEEQFEPFGTTYDYKIMVMFDDKLDTIEDIENFVTKYAISLKFNLMCKIYPELSEELIDKEIINKTLMWIPNK